MQDLAILKHFGLTLDTGQWTLDSGQWTLDSPLTTVDMIWTVHSAGAARRNILAAVTFLTELLHPVVLFQYSPAPAKLFC